MNISEFIRSKANRTTLEAYAIGMLQKEWPKMHQAVKNAVAMALDDSIDQGLRPYASWANTSENAQTINVEIYKKIKAFVTKSLQGAQIDPEEAIEESLRHREQMRGPNIGPIDNEMPDRELEALRDRHMSAWRP